jgi:hypothetical protein
LKTKDPRRVVGHDRIRLFMSAMGHKRTFVGMRTMSALC